MNRRQQILIRKRLARLASEEPLAGVGGLELKLRKMQLQRAKMAGIERGLQQALAFGEILENGTGLVLAAPAPDRGSDDADKRGRMKRTLNEGDVTQHLSQPHRIRIALGAAALMRQQHNWKVGP
jgi:hypothetical protein